MTAHVIIIMVTVLVPPRLQVQIEDCEFIIHSDGKLYHTLDVVAHLVSSH